MQQWAEANPHLAKQSNIRKMRKQGQITKEVADKILRANYEDRKAAIKKKSSAAPVKTSQPSPKPKAAGTKPVNKVPQRFADGAKGGKYDKAVKNKEKAKSNFFRSSSGTRGTNVPSNPKLKSQPTKPKRSSFPAGRSGATAYAAALARYRKLLARVPKVRRMTNRRGRAI